MEFFCDLRFNHENFGFFFSFKRKGPQPRIVKHINFLLWLFFLRIVMIDIKIHINSFISLHFFLFFKMEVFIFLIPSKIYLSHLTAHENSFSNIYILHKLIKTYFFQS